MILISIIGPVQVATVPTGYVEPGQELGSILEKQVKFPAPNKISVGTAMVNRDAKEENNFYITFPLNNSVFLLWIHKLIFAMHETIGEKPRMNI